MIKKPVWGNVAVLLFFIALAVAATWPIWSNPFEFSLYGIGQNDTMFHMWTIFWGYHALTTDPGSLLNANIFYPEPFTYLYSDVLLSDSLLAAPAIALFYHPHFIHNLLILLSISLGGLGMFLLARDLVGRSGAALFAAVVFMFNPAHFGRLLQLHLFGDHWMPWFLWALLRWFRGPGDAETERTHRFGWQWAALTVLFFVLNVLSGAHIAVIGTLIGVVVGLFYMLWQKLYLHRRFWLGLAAMALAALLILGPIFYPYVFIQDKMREQRVYSDHALRVGSAGAYELLSANSRFYNWLNATSGWPGDLFRKRLRGYLFVGVIPLLVAFIGLLRLSGKKEKKPVTLNTLAAWGLDIVLIAIGWMAVIYAISGNSDFLLPFVRFPAPPSYILLSASLVVAALRLIFLPRAEHAAVAACRRLCCSVRPVPEQWPWLVLVLVGLLLSLGPDWMLYSLFGKLPLINLIRVPRRFILVTSFALAVLCAYGMANIARGRAMWKRVAVIGALCAVFALEALPEPVNVYAARPPHPVYRWLGEQDGDFTVMEFPTGPRAYASFIRQVYGSIYHWKHLIVGYSGFQSDENTKLISELNQSFPDERCVEMLRDLNVRYVIVFPDRLDEEKRVKLALQKELRFERSIEGLDIYRLIDAKTQ